MMSSRKALLPLLALLAAACATTTTPAPSGTAVRTDAVLAPLSGAAPQIAEPRIRVGLVTDVASTSFPRIDGGYVVVADGGTFSTRRGFDVTAPGAGLAVRWGVRVATFGEQVAAQSEAARLRGMTSEPVSIVRDHAGKWRVLVGDFESDAAGAPVRDALLLQGYKPPLWVVRRPAAEPFSNELALVDDEENRQTIAGRSILVLPATGETVPIGASRYRGGARLFINDRGLLNLISELNLDDYVKGVVPAELGPRTYDELEAQKAQAIAARTYAAHRLGEYEAEGYDQCPTAACQVYRGFTIEEELSNRAVEATAGLVMTYGGEPIDALFTSTCGGETSDVGTMFPGRTDPYLKGVDCVELTMGELVGRRDAAEMTGETVALAAIFAAMAGLPSHTGILARDAVPAVEAANRILGWTPPADVAPPRSMRRGEIIDYLARNWHLSSLGAALTRPEDRRYFFEDRDPEDPRAAAQAFLIKYGLDPVQAAKGDALTEPMPREELYALLLSWLLEMGAIQDVQGRILSMEGAERMQLKLASGTRTLEIPRGTPAFRRYRDRYQEEQSVPVMVGDRVRAFVRANRPAAVVVEANYDGAAFDRTSAYSNWTRSYRADDLVKSIAKRVPIQSLGDLRVVDVDEAGRHRRMEVVAEGGRTFTLEGIQVRFSLEVPDNLFVFLKSKDADGMDRYTFFGKGWGHGTGLCQIGAYGAAFRGWDADRILKHYYTGVTIERFVP